MCSNRERLDPYNGLLLTPTLDALFDTGYISFGDDGYIRLSDTFPETSRQSLRISKSLRLRSIYPDNQRHLEFHRAAVFERRIPRRFIASLILLLLLNGAAAAQTAPFRAARIADINPGADDANPGGLAGREMVVFKDALYFSADDGASGGVFMYDGKEVRRVTDSKPRVTPGNIVSTFRFVVFNGDLIFSAHDETYGQELWKITAK